MPGKVKVKIISGRNLPVMDRSSDTTDAYVEIKLGSTTYKTDVCRKSLHPQWNTEWYRFDVDDSELQDEPLQIRLMDHDTYSANDAIGKVYLNLNPLLLPAASLLQKWNGESRVKENMSNTSMMSGWLPVYDTMHGIRGEVDITVKVEHFSDFNKFRQSSCGIQFFCSPAVPHGFYAQMVHGFVEELVVNDDPEYQWIDKIRTPRASNEARQTLFCKLSGEVQRKIGVKALDLGGNAVIGYRQSFDLEGESGIVARGIGTAVTLVKIMDHLTPNATAEEYNNEERALNYLNFLGSANGFFLPNITNTFDVSNNPCFAGSLAFLLPRALRTPPPSLSDIHSPHTAHHHTKNKHRHMTRHLSDKELMAKHVDSHLHHSVSLQTLLKQEDMRGSGGGGGGGRRNGNPTGYRISHRFWKFKHASHAKLAKRITHLKAKLSETTLDETAVSLDSERPLNYKYRRTQSDSTGGMAEILVRSVIHAANSLDCIAESPSVSPALLQVVHNKPISEENLVPSVSYLSLPGTSIGSVSSKTSSSSSSSSGEEDLDETVLLDNISDIVENARKLSMIKDVHPTRILEPPIIISESSPVPILNRKTRNENTKNLFFLELETDITDGDDGVVDYSDTVSEPVNFSPGKDEYDMGSFIYSEENGRSITELPEVDTETESLIPETEALVHNDTVLGVPFTNILKKDDTVKNFFRRSVSHNINQAYVEESLPRSVKNHHQSHETVLGIPFTNIFQHNNHNNNAETSSNHPSAMLHIEREYEVSERIPLPPKGMNKSATTICLNDLCSADSQHHSHVRKHHQSHETLVTIPFGSMYTTHEHVTVQFPETIREGAVIDFTCDRTITKNAPMKKSPTITSFKEYKTQPEHHKLHKNTSLDIVCNESIDDPQLYDDIVHYYEDDSECKTVLKKTHRSIPVKMGQFMDKLRGKFRRNTDESHGLLSTALGNVLMESVNEVLATTHSENVDAKDVTRSATIPEPEPSVTAKRDEAPEIKQSPGKKKTKLSRFYSIFRRNKSAKPEIKHGGLLETALDNVLLESMNEIIATQQPSPTCSPTVPLFPLTQPVLSGANSSQSETGTSAGPLTSTSMNNVTSGNTEHVSGVSDVFCGTNTNPLLHARLTPSRIGDSSQDFVTSATSGVTAPVSTSAAVAAGTSYANHTRSLIDQNGHGGHQRAESVGTKIVPYSPARLNSIPCIHRRSSDSDLSITSKGNSLTGSDRSGGYSSGHFMRTNAVIRSTVPQENFDILEYPFLTMNKYPPGFIAFLGGAVNARSVKLLERITNIEEPESRDIWWSEIRMEIRSHARALNCNAVLGYNETTSICDEVCVLSATGTAAVIGFQHIGDSTAPNTTAIPVPHDTTVTTDPMAPMTVSLDRNDFEKDRDRSPKTDVIAGHTTLAGTNNGNVTTTAIATPLKSPEKERNAVTVTAPVVTVTTAAQACSICHLPYTAKVAQLRNATSKCSICRSRKVPDILIATIEMPDGIPSIGRGCFLQAYVCRPLKDVRGGESNAKEISDGLPFLEYELHRLLLNKLKVKGMNAIFGLNVRISVGEKMLIGIGTGTAVFLSPLPVPPIPALRSTDEKKLAQLQKNLHDTVKKNREIYQLVNDLESTRILSDDDSEDDRPSLELTSGNKDCCILEVDDPEDVSELALLMEPRPPDGFHVVNTESVPGLEELEIVKNLQMFTQIWRSKVQHPYNLDKHFHRLLQTVYFKLRRMIPCALCDLQFRVESPEPDEIQLCVLGMALGLGDPLKNSKLKRKNFHTKRTDEELIFNIEDDLIPENSVAQLNTNLLHTQQTLKHRQKSPVRTRMTAKQHHVPYKERHGVDITPLSYVPGGKIEKYLGNLNFFFIRETNSIREEGGLSGFMHSFVTEVLAIVRSHVTALGGNAMVAYYLTECTLNHNLHKNQGQCLINVGGDVVFVTYYPEDH